MSKPLATEATLTNEEIVQRIHKLHARQKNLEQDLTTAVKTICDAYDPYTRTLQFKTRPLFNLSDEDLPMSLRRLPKVNPKRWGFIPNPDYDKVKKEAAAILRSYLDKNAAMLFQSDLQKQIDACQSQIRALQAQCTWS